MRIKTGTVRKANHRRMLKRAKGFRGRRGNCYKLAKRSVEKALKYSYRDRKVRRREFRALWNIRINAAARVHGLTYSRLINGLKRANLALDRKALAELAIHDAQAFGAVAEKARAALA